MPQLRAGTSNTPLWSLIQDKTGGLSWLGEVNWLVCVTLSQVATILLSGGLVYSSRFPWGHWAPRLSCSLVGSVVDGGAEE